MVKCIDCKKYNPKDASCSGHSCICYIDDKCSVVDEDCDFFKPKRSKK